MTLPVHSHKHEHMRSKNTSLGSQILSNTHTVVSYKFIKHNSIHKPITINRKHLVACNTKGPETLTHSISFITTCDREICHSELTLLFKCFM